MKNRIREPVGLTPSLLCEQRVIVSQLRAKLNLEIYDQ